MEPVAVPNRYLEPREPFYCDVCDAYDNDCTCTFYAEERP